MAVNFISHPESIDNSALYNVNTDKVEDSTHVNLRIRGEIYHEGIIKAVIDKPKGLTQFDFNDILKSLTPGLKFAKDSGDSVFTGTVGANLITSWAGSFSTLTTSGNEITSAVSTVLGSYCVSNPIPVVKGQLYSLYVETAVLTVAPRFEFYDSLGIACNLIIQPNKAIVSNTRNVTIMAIDSGNLYVRLVDNDVLSDFSGIFSCKQITTNQDTQGSPLATYYPLFTEVWEDVNGLTVTGDNSVDYSYFENAIGLFKYVPASVDATTFAEYVLWTTTAKFASRTFKNGITKFFTYSPVEMMVVFFTYWKDLELNYSKDGGANNHATHIACHEGWGAVLLNTGELMNGVTTSFAFYFKGIVSTTVASETLTILVDNSQIEEREVLEYDGIYGGKEYLAFEGIKNIRHNSVRKYFTGPNKNRKALSYKGMHHQTLETRFKDIPNAPYLEDLLNSESVNKLGKNYIASTEVTIVTDEAKSEFTDLFTNQIELEY